MEDKHDHHHNHDHDHHHDSELDHLHHHHGRDIALQGELDHAIEMVWQVLTQQDYIQKWFPQLKLRDNFAGGKIELVDSLGQAKESMMILDFEPPQLFSFNWKNNIISFELIAINQDKTQMNFNQWVNYIEEDTVEDVTYWLVRMQLIAAILNGEELEDVEVLFSKYHDSIKELIDKQDTMELDR